MKGLTKTIVALALVMTLIATMGMSALAAATGNYSTKTTYVSADEIKVVATATGLEKGDIVTYVATTDAAIVNENTIVYINQKEVGDDCKAEFEYTTEVANINASMFFGGSKEDTKVAAKHEGDYVINVTVDGDPKETPVYAAKQAAGVGPVIRKFDLSGIANFSGLEITGVEFNDVEIVDFCVAGSTLIVSTNAIDRDGKLAITTKAANFEAPRISKSITVKEGNLVAVAKAPAGEKFGIVLYKNDAPTTFAHEVKVANGDYVVLPALGKNVDGIYAVELQGYAEYLGDEAVKVAAYAFDGSDVVVSAPESVN